jgi:hypothetical protein
MKVDYSRFSYGMATWEACSGNLEKKTGTIPAFALGPRKTKKNLRKPRKTCCGKQRRMGAVYCNR